MAGRSVHPMIGTRPKVFEVRGLKVGDNTIAVRGTNIGASPAGLLLSLAMRAANGEEWHVVTDKKWQARLLVAGAAGQIGSLPWNSPCMAAAHGERCMARSHRTLDPMRSTRRWAWPRRIARPNIWATINTAFAEMQPAFKTLTNQLDLEEKILPQGCRHGANDRDGDGHKPRKTHILTAVPTTNPGPR